MGQGGEVKAAPAVRVLVVDDSPVDRKVVELLLRNHNHQGGAAPFHGQRLLLLPSRPVPSVPSGHSIPPLCCSRRPFSAARVL